MRLIGLLIALMLFTEAQADLIGRVVGVADGDTLTLLDAKNQTTKVRLAKIDAPEKRQDFGQRSKQSLSDLVFNQQVRIEVRDTDRYGRKVGTVWVNGMDANREQVKRGMAWVYRQYTRDPAYLAEESIAREKGVGLWSQPNPTPPWEFRHGKKPNRTKRAAIRSPAGSCGNKRRCRQMVDCAEARFYLDVCGVRGLDGDGDGVPCEAICRE